MGLRDALIVISIRLRPILVRHVCFRHRFKSNKTIDQNSPKIFYALWGVEKHPLFLVFRGRFS